MVWSGPKIIEGSGAVGQQVDGIVWYDGVPTGKWEVLGAVGTQHYTGGNLAWNAIAGGAAKGKAISAAKKLGGEAVVLWSESGKLAGSGTGGIKMSHEGTYLVVRQVK